MAVVLGVVACGARTPVMCVACSMKHVHTDMLAFYSLLHQSSGVHIITSVTLGANAVWHRELQQACHCYTGNRGEYADDA